MNTYLSFKRRASQIPFHGIGLSVDVYSPDLSELMAALSHHRVSCGYLEIFKASRRALREVRSRLPSMVLNYHAEGLWISQPDWETAYPFQEEIEITADHLGELRSYWLTQECASKQMVGYSFGTYLPPLFTEGSAAITAKNATSTQDRLDRRLKHVRGMPPLLLLETPPLTYFGFGDLSYPEFFRCLTEWCSCGLVLDIGHIWTVFRYSGAWRHHSLDDFLETFLHSFPLERVVQIHLAGLDWHPSEGSGKTLNRQDPQEWVDSHAARIPGVLWKMLDRVLESPDLLNLKGIALEVDTKAIKLIVEELSAFQTRYQWWAQGKFSTPKNPVRLHSGLPGNANPGTFGDSRLIQELVKEYRHYVSAITGQEHPRHQCLDKNGEEFEIQLGKYVHDYLPYEVMVWGGCLRDMFPRTIQALEKEGFDPSTFVPSWYGSPRPSQEPYDYFQLKIDYFVEFVENSCPRLCELVSQEASGLREGYAMANDL